MGEFSIWHWMIVLLVILLLFGSGKMSGLMGDFAKGIKSFKKNMAEDDPPARPAEPIGLPSGLVDPGQPTPVPHVPEMAVDEPADAGARKVPQPHDG